MITNPFVSKTYTQIWSKHFNNSKSGKEFNFIENVSFVKNKLPHLYQNLGVNLTSGITYKLNDNQFDDYKGKTFIIRDIPTYHEIEEPDSISSLKLKKIFQYEGFTTEVSNFDDLDHYMKTIFKSNSRYKFRRNMERLEACFDIVYTMYHGVISKQEFDYVFEEFYKLFDKRYTDKQEICGELQPELWAYYCDLAYNMILEKTASLFVIYNDKKPIGITFNYHFGSIFIEALTVFDIDYYKFNIGHTTIYKLLDWSFNNGVTLFDFTHGDFDYKRRWSNNTYQKNHHLLYDSSSIYSRLLALYIEKMFNFKRILRDKKVIKKYHDLKYKIANISSKKKLEFISYTVEPLEESKPVIDKKLLVNIYDESMMSQRKAVFDYFYKYPESVKDVKFYKHNNSEGIYYALGNENVLIIQKAHN